MTWTLSSSYMTFHAFKKVLLKKVGNSMTLSTCAIPNTKSKNLPSSTLLNQKEQKLLMCLRPPTLFSNITNGTRNTLKLRQSTTISLIKIWWLENQWLSRSQEVPMIWCAHLLKRELVNLHLVIKLITKEIFLLSNPRLLWRKTVSLVPERNNLNKMIKQVWTVLLYPQEEGQLYLNSDMMILAPATPVLIVS
jgi:hypothetical protein